MSTAPGPLPGAARPQGQATRAVAAGTAWISIAHQIQQLVLLVVLARLLLPEDYGMFGMVMVLIGFVGLLVEPVLGAALVQRTTVTETQASSVFWLKLGFGLGLALLFAGAAPLVAAFFRLDALAPLSLALSATFVFSALGIVPRALLQRRLALRRLAAIDLAAWLVAGVGAVLLALHGFGVWSLVFQSLAAGMLTALLLLISARWLPRLVFSMPELRGLLGFGANVLGANALNYWTRNASTLVLGQFVGAHGLGVFTRASNFVTIPVTQAQVVFGKVVFPSLAACQDNPLLARRVYLRATAMIALLVFPLLTGLLVTAVPLVATLFGPNWVAVAPVLQVLCVAGMVQVVCAPAAWIYTSQGQTSTMLRWGMLQMGVMVPAVLLGALVGSVGSVAWAFALAHMVLAVPCIRMAGRFIGVSVADVGRATGGAFACAAVMGCLVWTLGALLPAAWPPASVTAASVLVGAAAYGMLVAALGLAAFRDLRGLLFGGRRSGEAVVAAVG
jgi:O-antigen/teichoic acid export membrane protein